METLNDRVKLVIENSGLSIPALAKKLGFTKQAFYDITGNKRRQPSIKLMSAIARHMPEVNTDWLLDGIGSMYKTEDSPKADSLKSDPKKSATNHGHLNGHLNGNLLPEKDDKPENVRNRLSNVIKSKASLPSVAPVLFLPEATASAGGGAFLESVEHSSSQSIMIPGLQSHREYLCIRTEGDSMAPTFLDKDYIVISQVTDLTKIRENYVCVVLTRDSGYLKRVTYRPNGTPRLVMRSDNPGYTTFELPMVDVVSVYYVHMRITAQFPSDLRIMNSRIHALEDQMGKLRSKLEDGGLYLD